METRTYIVYEFNELNEEAKQKAIENWYEGEDYFTLKEDLTEYCQQLLADAKIKGLAKVYYSLSYSQGDGVCFTGIFTWKELSVSIKHTGRYYHRNSTEIYMTDIEGNEEESRSEEFKKIYDSICYELEKAGYEQIEYRMDNKEFDELCQANGYMFLKNGKMSN